MPPPPARPESAEAVPDRVGGLVYYLLAAPATVANLPQSPDRVQPLKDVPYFYVVDIDVRTLARESMTVAGIDFAIWRQIYDGVVQISECRFALPDALGGDALQTKSRVQSATSFTWMSGKRPSNQRMAPAASTRRAAAVLPRRVFRFGPGHGLIAARRPVGSRFRHRAATPPTPHSDAGNSCWAAVGRCHTPCPARGP